MDYPLGEMVGNRNEVWECIEAMSANSRYSKILEDLEINEALPSMI